MGNNTVTDLQLKRLRDKYEKNGANIRDANALASQEQAQQESQLNQNVEENTSLNGWQQFGSWLEEFGDSFARTFLDLGEGVVDAFALGVGSLQEAFGDSNGAKNTKDFIARDFTREFIDEGNAFGTGIDAFRWLNLPSEILFGSETRDYVRQNDVLPDVVDNIASSVGSSLGMRALGAIPYVGVAAQWMGSGGASAENALQSDSTLSMTDAMHYGMISGGIEVGTEAFVGKALDKFKEYLGTTKVAGNIASKLGNSKMYGVGKNVGSSMIGQLATQFNEEGLEEVVSEVLDPLARLVTVDKDKVSGNILKDYWDVFQDNGGFENVLQSYINGGLGALAMGATQMGVSVARNGYSATKLAMYGNQIYEYNEQIKKVYEDNNIEKAQAIEAQKQNFIENEIPQAFKEYLDELRQQSEEADRKYQEENATKEETLKNLVEQINSTQDSAEKSKLQAQFITELQSMPSKPSGYSNRQMRQMAIQQQIDNQINRNGQYEAVTEMGADVGLKSTNVTVDNDLKVGSLASKNGNYIKFKGKMLSQRDWVSTVLHEYGHIFSRGSSTLVDNILNDNYTDEEMSNALNEYANKYKDVYTDDVIIKEHSKEFETLNAEENKSKIDEYRKQMLREEIAVDYLSNMFESITEFKKALKGTKLGVLQRFKDTITDLFSKEKKHKKPKNYYDILNEINKAIAKSEEMQSKEKSSDSEYNFEERYKLDNEGNELSKNQIEYFKDSKVRDENGNLLVVYHGTSEKFTVFDRTKSRASMDIQGNFFSPYKSDSEGYGKYVNSYYINLVNPADWETSFDIFNKYKGQENAGVKASEELISLGYDGVIGDEEYIVFDSKNIKLTTNENPTENDDIRYKLDENAKNDTGDNYNEKYKRSTPLSNGNNEKYQELYNILLQETNQDNRDKIAKRLDLYVINKPADYILMNDIKTIVKEYKAKNVVVEEKTETPQNKTVETDAKEKESITKRDSINEEFKDSIDRMKTIKKTINSRGELGKVEIQKNDKLTSTTLKTIFDNIYKESGSKERAILFAEKVKPLYEEYRKLYKEYEAKIKQENANDNTLKELKVILETLQSRLSIAEKYIDKREKLERKQEESTKKNGGKKLTTNELNKAVEETLTIDEKKEYTSTTETMDKAIENEKKAIENENSNVEDISSTIEASEDALEKLENSNEDKATIEKLQSRLDNLKKQLKALKLQLKERNDRLELYTNRYKESLENWKNDRYVGRVAEVKSLRNTLSKYAKELEYFGIENVRLENLTEEQQKLLKENYQELDGLKERVDTLEKRIKSQQETLSKTRVELREAQDLNKSYGNKIMKIEFENKSGYRYPYKFASFLQNIMKNIGKVSGKRAYISNESATKIAYAIVSNNIEIQEAVELFIDELRNTTVTIKGKEIQYSDIIDMLDTDSSAQYETLIDSITETFTQIREGRKLTRLSQLEMALKEITLNYKEEKRINALTTKNKNAIKRFKNKFTKLLGKYKFGAVNSKGLVKALKKLTSSLSTTEGNIKNGNHFIALYDFYKEYITLDSDEIDIKIPDTILKMIETIKNNESTINEETKLYYTNQIFNGLNVYITQITGDALYTINGRTMRMREWNARVVKEMNEIKRDRKWNKLSYFVAPRVVFQMMAAENHNSVLLDVYEDLEKGQNKLMESFVRMFEDYNNFARTSEGRKLFKELSKKGEKHEIELSYGDNKIKARKSQLLSFYELVKREHALEHIVRKGITLDDENVISFKNSETEIEIENIQKEIDKLSLERKSTVDIDERKELKEEIKELKERKKELKEQLKTDAENLINTLVQSISNYFDLENDNSVYKKYIDEVEKVFKQAKLEKINTDLITKGITNVEEGNYFPIAVSDLALSSDISTADFNSSNMVGAKSYGMNMDTSSTNTSIQLNDIEKVLERHVNDMCNYVGYAPILNTFNMLYNGRTNDSDNFRNALKRSYEKFDRNKAEEYLKKLFRDLQGMKAGKGEADKVFNSVINKLRGHVASVNLFLNPKVIFSQISSVPAAMKYIKSANIVKALPYITGKYGSNLPEIALSGKYRNMNKSVINAETFGGRLTKMGEFGGQFIQMMDQGAINIIWAASCFQENVDSYKVGSDEYKQAVDRATILFNKAVNHTQPNYNPLGRSELMRTESDFVKLFTMFKSQAQQNFSNLVEMVYKIKLGTGDKDEYLATLIGLLIQGIIYSLIGDLSKRVINNDWYGKKSFEEELGNFGIEFVNDNILNMIPLLDQFKIDLSSNTKITMNDLSAGWLDSVFNAFNGLIDGKVTPKEFVTALSYGSGLPLTNMIKWTKTFAQYIAPEYVYTFDTWYTSKDTTEKSNINEAITSSERMGKAAYKAYTNNTMDFSTDSYEELFRLYENGYTDTTVRKIPETISYNGEQIEVNKTEFKNIYSMVAKKIDKLYKAYSYKKLSNDEKASVTKYLMNMYYNIAKKNVTGQEMSTLEKLLLNGYELTNAQILSLAKISNMEADEKNSKKQNIVNYINSLNVLKGEKYWVLLLSGYSINDDNKKYAKAYLMNNGFSYKEAKSILQM